MQLAELRLLWESIRGVPAGASRTERTSVPHRPQASRRSNAHNDVQSGRVRLLQALAPEPGHRVVELGAGAGNMLDVWGTRLQTLAALELVDISPSMLAQARRRALGCRNVRVVEGDAACYRAPWLADCVYFSYSLTMIPDWVRALNNALAMLRPGGKLGIVDYYVSGSDHSNARVRHAMLSQWFWTRWFAQGQVHLCANHLLALDTLTERVHLHEARGAVPHLPLVKAPYYVFVGVKPARPSVGLIADLWKKSAERS